MTARKRHNLEENNIEMNSDDCSFTLSKSNKLRGDVSNIALLFFLYTLQGIPLGLSAAIPMVLQNRGVNYRQQAEFSFVNWPFSLKLLWAPIVDAIFWPSLGRRKTWLIPTQYLLGVCMFFLSSYVDDWLGDENNLPNIGLLTFGFVVLNFLAATQDIAVDGWALTMLKKCNVGHASTCNSTGQTAGFFLGYVLFMALESADFCNNYLRSVPENVGIVTLSEFLYFWGVVFIITTTLVALLKKESEEDLTDKGNNQEVNTNIVQAYMTLYKISKLPPIRILALILLTAKMGFAATDAVSSLKMVEGGLPKEKLGFMAVPLIPVQIILVLVISKWTTGPRPMDVFIKAIPYRLIFSFVAAGLVWLTPKLINDGNIPPFYYAVLLITYGFHQVCLYSMFVAVMAFFAKISDPSFGGTYMTLLNTLCNLGGNWPATLVLWLVDGLTWRSCDSSDSKVINNSCNSLEERKECVAEGGKCNIILDGFYLETVICVVIGFLWLIWAKKKIQNLQSLKEDSWKVEKSKSITR